jgi:hypothetical protein
MRLRLEPSRWVVGLAEVKPVQTRFRRSVESFADANHVPVIRFGRNDRKIDLIRPLMRRAARNGRSRVVAVGVAQEFQQVFTASKKTSGTGAVWFSYSKAQRRTTCYYFYLWSLTPILRHVRWRIPSP